MRHYGLWSESHQCWATNSDLMVFATPSLGVAVVQLELSKRSEPSLEIRIFPEPEIVDRPTPEAIDLSKLTVAPE